MKIRICLPALAFLTGSNVALADAEAGKILHDTHCTKCHGTEVYTRKNRVVKNPEGLKKQVSRCQLSVGANWFDEDVDNVVDYLNSSFYKFEK